MKKNKLITLLVAGILTVGVVGATFAWFTSDDNITNKFTTGSTPLEDTDGDGIPDKNGIEIEENFKPEDAQNITPGTEVTKEVKVSNKASYTQFIRVKLTPVWNAPEAIKGTDDYIKLNYDDNALSTEPTEGKWYHAADGYYYYVGSVGADKATSLLLKSVTLEKDATTVYANGQFDVVVESDSIQASNGAYVDWMKDLEDEKLAEALKGLED